MGKNYNIDIDNIDIDSWKKFVANNESIEKSLDVCCSNIADMIANVTTVNATVSEVNAALGKLKTVPPPSVPSAEELQSEINEIDNYMKEKAILIVAGCSYAEAAIEAYSKGTDVDQETKDLFAKIMSGVFDTGLYWIISSVLENRGFKAASFILGYGTDAAHDGGDFVVGDAAAKLFKIHAAKIDIKPGDLIWKNAAVGAAVVWFFTLAKDRITDKGEWTDDDIKRAGLDALFSGLSYAEWSIIVGLLSPPGAVAVSAVAVAAIFAIPTAAIFKTIKDRATHDNIIHTFERDGNPYEIPDNGSGKDGTFDVWIDIFGSNGKEYHIGNRLCSEHEYKDKMYGDLENFIYEDTGKKFGEMNEFGYGKIFQKALDIMSECDTYEEGIDAFYAYYSENSYGDNMDLILVNEYGFNFEEYYNYNHKE